MRSCSATSGVIAATVAAVDAAGVDAAAALSGVAPRVLVVLASGVEARESVEADAVGPTLDGKMHSMSQLRDQGVSWTELRCVFRKTSLWVLPRRNRRLTSCSGDRDREGHRSVCTHAQSQLSECRNGGTDRARRRALTAWPCDTRRMLPCSERVARTCPVRDPDLLRRSSRTLCASLVASVRFGLVSRNENRSRGRSADLRPVIRGLTAADLQVIEDLIVLESFACMLLACSWQHRSTQAILRSRAQLAASNLLRPRSDQLRLPNLESRAAPRSCYSAATTMADPKLSDTGGSLHKPARAGGAAVRAPKRRSQKPVLVGEWQPTLPSRMGARSKGCGHYAWGNPLMAERIAAFGEFVMLLSTLSVGASCSDALLSASSDADGQALKRLDSDLDGTVIQPKDGKAFPKDSFDWQFCSPLVVPKLRELHRAGSVDRICFFSTPAGECKLTPSVTQLLARPHLESSVLEPKTRNGLSEEGPVHLSQDRRSLAHICVLGF